MLSVLPLLVDRPGSRAIDSRTEVTSQELASLLEAARAAPPSRGSRGWRFGMARRDDESYKRIVSALPTTDRDWVGRAPVLLLGAHLTGADGPTLAHAAYDLGQAVGYVTIQAASLGLVAWQLADFDAAALHGELGLPADVRPTVVVAVGRPGDPQSLPRELRDDAHPQREPIGGLLLI